MKQTEKKISITFMMIFFVQLIIGGIYDKCIMNSKFISRLGIAVALAYAIVYLVFIWINTRRHKSLANLAFLAINILVILLANSKGNLIEEFVEIGAFNIINAVIVAFPIAALSLKHAKELLEEDKNI